MGRRSFHCRRCCATRKSLEGSSQSKKSLRLRISPFQRNGGESWMRYWTDPKTQYQGRTDNICSFFVLYDLHKTKVIASPHLRFDIAFCFTLLLKRLLDHYLQHTATTSWICLVVTGRVLLIVNHRAFGHRLVDGTLASYVLVTVISTHSPVSHCGSASLLDVMYVIAVQTASTMGSVLVCFGCSNDSCISQYLVNIQVNHRTSTMKLQFFMFPIKKWIDYYKFQCEFMDQVERQEMGSRMVGSADSNWRNVGAHPPIEDHYL